MSSPSGSRYEDSKMKIKAGLASIIFSLIVAFAVSSQTPSGDIASKLRISLKVVGNDLKTPQTTFTTDEAVYVNIIGTYQGDTDISISLVSAQIHKQLLLSLTRNGVLVKYGGKMKEQLENPQESAYSGPVISTTLRPGEEKRIDVLYLPAWYGKLEAGIYTLTFQLNPGEGGRRNQRLFSSSLLINSRIIDVTPFTRHFSKAFTGNFPPGLT
jgi:hypothetical protein